MRTFAALFLGLLAVPSQGREVLVFAAASLTESLQELGKTFESRTGASIRFSYGASSDLARQIKAGAPADVFFSADTAKMEDLETAGLVRRADRREFLSNELVVVVPSGSRLRISRPEDLTALPRLALADPEVVPAGIYARKWLENSGLWLRIKSKVVPTLDVRGALAAVATEAVPAAIVYRTDAAISKKVSVAYEIKDGPDILYSLARLARSENPNAQKFVDYLTGEVGRALFERRGFVIRKVFGLGH